MCGIIDNPISQQPSLELCLVKISCFGDLAGILWMFGGYGLFCVYIILIRIGRNLKFTWFSIRVVGGILRYLD